MKYRIQFEATFNNTDANNIINEIESVKSKVFSPNAFTPVEIVRLCEKSEYNVDPISPTVYSSVDFDSVVVTHLDLPPVSDLTVKIDISFDVQQDFYDCINYLESIKSLADNTKSRICRNFVCNHDSNPLIKDGVYDVMNFDGSQLVYPLT